MVVLVINNQAFTMGEKVTVFPYSGVKYSGTITSIAFYDGELVMTVLTATDIHIPNFLKDIKEIFHYQRGIY
jgi:hypothetical protein